MGIEPLGNSLKLGSNAREKLKLEPGEIVQVNVIKELAPGKWAIGIKGAVLSARTKLELQPRENLTALVSKDSTSIVLKLTNENDLTPAVNLQRQGLPADPISMLIISNLIGIGAKIDDQAIKAFRQMLSRLSGNLKRNAKIISILIAKGIKPEDISLAEIIRQIDFGFDYPENKKREGKNKKREAAPDTEDVIREIRKEVENAVAGKPDLLALFNHLSCLAGDNDWIVIPVRYGGVTPTFAGTIRLCINRRTARLKKAVIIVETGESNRIQFVLEPRDKKYSLKVFSNQMRLIGTRLAHFRENTAKLGKLGVECDDIIKDGRNFNGFDEDEAIGAYRSVDTKG